MMYIFPENLCSVLCDDLSGATSDILCSATDRSVTGLPYGGGGALGVVVVSKQRTSHDCQATLKFNCHQDDLVKRLIDKYDILEDVKEEAVIIRLDHETAVTQRSSVLSSLQEAVKYEEDDPRIYHGRLFSSICLAEPKRSDEDELQDSDNVVSQKIKFLTDLFKMSKRTLVYTEAVTNQNHSHSGLKFIKH